MRLSRAWPSSDLAAVVATLRVRTPSGVLFAEPPSGGLAGQAFRQERLEFAETRGHTTRPRRRLEVGTSVPANQRAADTGNSPH